MKTPAKRRSATAFTMEADALRKAGGSLREGQEQFKADQAGLTAIINSAVDAILTIDEFGRINSINPATEKLFGYSASELMGRNIKLLMPEPYRREHDGYLRQYRRTGRARIIGIGREVIGRRKDGSTFPLSLAVSEMRMSGKRMFTGIIHDLTTRRHLELQLLEATAEEQRRIGRDLHDGLCQELVSLALGIELVYRKLSSTKSPEAAAIHKLGDSLVGITQQARNLARGLNPVDLHAGGLPLALKQLANRVSEATQIQCGVLCDRRAQAQNGTVATHLYRIAQEAVSNAIRHANPSRIDLELSCARGYLTLKVEDDGRGLPKSFSVLPPASANAKKPSSQTRARPASGIGLQTMNYRARLIGGTFDIGPGRNGGTRVVCAVRYDPP